MLALVALAYAACPCARAWGCEGHQIIAYIAEAHLNPRARSAALKILSASPIDPSLSRYCQPRSTDPFVDASTWADDIRSVRPQTAAWHFIDIPRSAHRGSLAPYCPPATGCVVTALQAQLAILKNRKSSAAARADALRFIIHFLGDIHQPLHNATNNDLGGNCIPVEFLGKLPKETEPSRESFDPNLHWVWDVGIINRSAYPAVPATRRINFQDRARGIAAYLDRKYRAQISGWESQPIDFPSWAWESHSLADSVAYGKLPHPIPIEPPRSVNSCADDNHVALRTLRLHENLGYAYQTGATPVVEAQLAKAAARLAALLNSLLQ
ncbi:MAG: S1/P1 nuclease [Acidobacteriota bacterium]|nr:S1/P1 nuclease [Acidobacteriota bacterium]